MTHGSLFSGIGGFDLAAEWVGWDNLFHCEWNPFCQKILKYYWPNATSYGDITKTDFTIWRGKIDVLSGGFPCQPYSQAGKRLGKEDDRHLWPEMLRAIREIQPRWVIGENVHGLVNWSGGLVFNEVQTEMEAEGYEVFPYVLPACGIGAIHRRERVWFVAHNDSFRFNGCECKYEINKSEGWEYALNDIEQVYNVTNTNNSRREKCRTEWISPIQFTQNNRFASEPGICRGDDGFPYRVDRLKSLGNAIVPHVALQLFKTIEQFEKLKQ